MPSPITFVSGDGWQALYINGRLALEDHRLTLPELAKTLATADFDCTAVEADQDWLESQPKLPERLADVLLK